MSENEDINPKIYSLGMIYTFYWPNFANKHLVKDYLMVNISITNCAKCVLCERIKLDVKILD